MKKIDKVIHFCYNYKVINKIKGMATTKRRIPVTLPLDLESILENFSRKNKISLSQSINIFLREGLENAEDNYLGALADDLGTRTKKFESHEAFWKDVLPA